MAKKFDWSAPLYCHPHIAVAVGAEAGIVYERLRWMIQDSKGKKTAFGTIRDDGRRWVDFTYAQLLEYLPIFKNTKSLRDVITKLEKAGLIDSESFTGGKWYTISDLDPATLTKFVTPEPDENRQTPCQKSSGGRDKDRQPAMTKNDAPPDEIRHPPIYKESESTSESKAEPDTESLFSSDPPPVASESPAAAVEEKEELSKPSTESENDLLIKSLARLCGINLHAATPAIKRVLQSAVDAIKARDSQVTPSDFGYYERFYDEQRQSGTRPRPICPTPVFVAQGWGVFIKWYNIEMDKPEYRIIPGTDDFVELTKGTWVYLDELPVGEKFTYCGSFGQTTDYIRQPNGTFRRVEQVAQVS